MTYAGGMELRQEDVDVQLPGLLELLISLQEQDIEIVHREDSLWASTTPNEYQMALIGLYFVELSLLQPGGCWGCGHWSMRRYTAFWEPFPMFCDKCRHTAVDLMDDRGWPSVKIPDRYEAD